MFNDKKVPVVACGQLMGGDIIPLGEDWYGLGTVMHVEWLPRDRTMLHVFDMMNSNILTFSLPASQRIEVWNG